MGKKSNPRVLGELIDERAERNGDKIFLHFKDRKYSYDEMRRLSNRCANGFQNLGVGKGDKVSIMLPNCPEYLFVWFGLAKCGAVEVPVNTFYKGEFLRHIVNLQLQARCTDRGGARPRVVRAVARSHPRTPPLSAGVTVVGPVMSSCGSPSLR